MLFCLNGRFIDAKKATVSVLDNGFLYADGFYDTMRVYDGVIFELPLHLRRIEQSAEKMDIPLPWGLEKISVWLQKIVTINKLREARVRITITLGPQGHDVERAKKPTLVLTCEILSPRHSSLRGESACTMRMIRPWPEIKTLGGLAVLFLAKREVRRKGCDQMIGIDAFGFVREAATSNVFVVRNGRVLTPKNGILKGLTRQRVLALARRSGITVIVRDFKTGILNNPDEIFLTNRVREIIPIVKLNDKKVGSGKTGPVTEKLMKAYSEYVRHYLGIR